MMGGDARDGCFGDRCTSARVGPRGGDIYSTKENVYRI